MRGALGAYRDLPLLKHLRPMQTHTLTHKTRTHALVPTKKRAGWWGFDLVEKNKGA